MYITKHYGRIPEPIRIKREPVFPLDRLRKNECLVVVEEDKFDTVRRDVNIYNIRAKKECRPILHVRYDGEIMRVYK